MPLDQLPAVCRNAAKLLRNLADLMDLMAEDKITHVYYHDADKEKAQELHAKKKEEKNSA